MRKERENDKTFLKDIHEKFYGKKKRREQRKAEEGKQMLLFDTHEGDRGRRL